MADFSALIQRIKDAVYENGVQAITGQILQDCLKDVVNTVNVAKQDGIYRVTVTVDNNTGVPSATARMDDDTYTLEFSFHNLKGEKGDKGDKGDTPVLTADSDGVIYSDGVMLTRVIKDTTDALTTRADSDHARAESDHARAETDHTDITRARGDAETAAGEANYASLRANTAADNADAAREAIQSDLAQKQDVIPDLQQIRAGATDTVKYTSQSLTDAQKEQARTNIGAASDSEVSQLRSEKADKDGYYPEMSVGSLKGTEVTQVEGITTIAKSTGIAKINEVMGKSLVWNQLVQNGDFSDGTTGWVSAASSLSVNDSTLTISAQAKYGRTEKSVSINSNRIYILSAYIVSDDPVHIQLRNDSQITNLFDNATTNGWNRYIVNVTGLASGDVINMRILNYASANWNPIYVKNVTLIDLTLMFGAGNEPSTVEEFEALYPLPYYAYNPGEIISNNTEALEITGLNQWDEEWEVGAIDDTTGAKVNNATSIRSKNDIEVLPNTTYFYCCTTSGVDSPRVAFLDSEHNTISVTVSGLLNRTFVTPANCKYIRFSSHTTKYGNVYKHDICINVSSSANGTYQPYEQPSEFALDLATITGKLNGEGESVVIFPDGMRSAGTAFDSLIVDEDGWCRRAVRRFEVVDMGTMDYAPVTNTHGVKYFQSPSLNNVIAVAYARNKYCTPFLVWGGSSRYSNATTYESTISTASNGKTICIVPEKEYESGTAYKTAMAGVPLIYELDTPLEYVLDTPIQMTFQAKHGGVIRQLPENGSAPTTAPMRMSVTYALPPEALISGASLENLLNALKTANKITNYTMTYNPTSGKWEFTIS